MKKIYLVLIFFFFLFQFSFLPILEWNIQVPNLILIVVTILGTRKTLMENISWFLLAGFIFEVFSAEFFGFNLILFVLTGISIWFFRNIILNKEYNILIEILFWFLVKIIWDIFYLGALLLSDFFQRIDEKEVLFLVNNYFKETTLFIFCGVSITVVCKKFLSDK